MNKSANKIHIALDISFALPNKTLTITNANTPAIIPVVILWVSGVTIMAASAGIRSERLPVSRFLYSPHIKIPTTTSAGATAKVGMIVNIGANGIASRNKIPTTIAVRPVLPPSIIPVELSMYVTTGEVPKRDPIIGPSASTLKTFLSLGSLPFSSYPSTFVVSAVKVPIVSNREITRNVTAMIIKSINALTPVNTPLASPNLNATLPSDPPRLLLIIAVGINDWSGKTGHPASSKTTPIMYVAIIPIRIFPFTFFFIKTIMMTKQINAKRFPRVKIVEALPSPISCVAQFASPIFITCEEYDRIPRLLKPNARINKPIPIDIPNLKESGIE